MNFYQVLSPSADDQGVWIHQDAWFHLADFDEGKSQKIKQKKAGNGFYFFVLEGSVEIEGRSTLRTRWNGNLGCRRSLLHVQIKFQSIAHGSSNEFVGSPSFTRIQIE